MVSTVIDIPASDHNAFIQDFAFADGSGGFRAVTANVHHDNGFDELKEPFFEIDGYHPSVWICQEVKKKRGTLKLFSVLGLDYEHAEPEFAIAWDPAVWKFMWTHAPQMSPLKYWTFNYALIVVLKHKKTGKLIRFMSYHPPAHVQNPNHKTHQKVMAVLKDFMRKSKRIARRDKTPNFNIYASCFAGDDNVDESRGWAPPKGGWEFMLHGPLEQIEAPEGTHGREKTGRRIDDFRITRKLIVRDSLKKDQV